jgi:hypothetical protein
MLFFCSGVNTPSIRSIVTSGMVASFSELRGTNPGKLDAMSLHRPARSSSGVEGTSYSL